MMFTFIFCLISLIAIACVSGFRSVRNFQPKICTSICAAATETPPGIEDIPKELPSVKGIDYIPLATMLAIGDFKGADQFTRDNLIKLAGPDAVRRGFVYFTDVKDLPTEDLVTMEKLWLLFSGGNFGYSVQRRVWDVEHQDFDNFIRRIGWTTIQNGIERNLKWFPPNEFIYDVEKAPKGHLPLTSALRGTQLIRALMAHPVWTMYDWKNYKDL
mmetsp:Transcript_17428/g.17517  ORF Transcript_17428/g.17517 Transcript_17428/m.17517 type:complete len:215 (-) Transcript_17428:40-684(-)